MSDALVDTSELLVHPAMVAWRALGLDRPEPDRLVVLKGNSKRHVAKKSEVYRLSRRGPGGYVIVAKKCRYATGLVERVIYTEVLPQLPVPTLAFYGLLEDAEHNACWLFVDDAGDQEYTRELNRHRQLSASWLALLHGCSARTSMTDRLPSRDPGEWLAQLRAACDAIRQNMRQPVLTAEDRQLFDELLRRGDDAEKLWARISGFCGEMPRSVVHGDFVAKNMRVGHIDGREVLLPYDWEAAGWGVPAPDLTQHSTHSPYPDLQTYHREARRFWPQLRMPDVQMLAAVGRIFRLISGIGWASDSLGYDRSRAWLDKPVAQLRTYEAAFREALRDVEAIPSHPVTVTKRLPDDQEMVSGLAAALLDSGSSHAPVAVLARRANGSQSTHPSEVITYRSGAGTEHRVFLKYGTAYVRYSYGHRGAVAYEANVYKTLLRSMDVSVPAFMGTYTHPMTGASWLALEYLEGCTVVSEKVAGSMPAAARWIGTFHKAAGDRFPALTDFNNYDAEYYLGWVDRTSRFAADLHREFLWLRHLCSQRAALADCFLTIPRTVIHGEYYYKNVLIQNGTIRPIDWESAAVAFGEIDFAALVDGRWPQDVVQDSQREYRIARWRAGVPADYERRMDAARLYLQFRWLGNHPQWTTSDKRRWRFDALEAAARRLGLL